MKRRTKSLLCFILAAALSLCSTIPGLLLNSASAQVPLDKGPTPTWDATPLEEAQVVDRLNLQLYLPQQEASAVYDQIASEGGTVVEASTHYQAGCGYTVTVSCLAAILPQNDGKWRVAILDLWTKASGIGDYTWDEFYVYADISEQNPQTIRLMARGSLTVETTVNNPADWETSGFTASVPNGNTICYNKVFSVDETTALPMA